MPRSESDLRKPLAKREAGMHDAPPAEKRARCEESKSQVLPRGEKDSPADRGACEQESDVQGSE